MSFKQEKKELKQYIATQDKSAFKNLMLELKSKYTLPSKEGIDLILLQLHSDFVFTYDFKSLEITAEKSIDIVRDFGEQEQKVRFFSNLGIIKSQLSKLDESLHYYQEALRNCTSEDTNELLMDVHSNIAVIYKNRAEYRKALWHLMQAYTFSNKYNQDESPLFYRILTNIGVTYMALSNFDQAIHYFLMAIDTISEPDKSKLLPLIFNNLASCHILMNEPENAKEYLDRFDKQFNELQPNFKLSETSINSYYLHYSFANTRIKSSYLYTLEKYQEALDLLMSVLELVESKESNHERLNFYQMIMSCSMKLEDYDTVKKYLDLSDTLTDDKFHMNLPDLRISYYKAIGEFEQALEWSTNYNEFLKKSRTDAYATSIEDINSTLNESNDSIALSAYQEKLNELKYLNYELAHDKALLINNLANLKEEKSIRDKLISIITHDIRGPMGIVDQMLQLIDKPDDFYHDDVVLINIKETVSKTYKLTEDLVGWSKEVISGLERSKEEIYLFDCFEEIINFFKKRLKDKGVFIENSIASNSTITAEYISLKTIFRNIVQNAIKYSTESGKIVVSEERDVQSLILTIKDSGVGMPQEKADTIFELVSDSIIGTANEKGVGMGMVLVKELVNKQSGSIQCFSEVGKGTRFEITFPLGNN